MLNVHFRDNHIHLRNNIHLTEVDKLHFDNLLETDSHFAKITRERTDHYFYMKNASEYHPFGANRYIKQENIKPSFLGPFEFTAISGQGELTFDINISDSENNDLSLSLKPGNILPFPFILVKIGNNNYDIIGEPTTGIQNTTFTLQLTDLKAPIEQTGQREYVDQEFSIEIFGTPTGKINTDIPFRVFLGDSINTIINNLKIDLDNNMDIQFNDSKDRGITSEELGGDIIVNLNEINSVNISSGKTFFYNITNNLGLTASIERDYFVIEEDIPTSTKTEMTNAVNNLTEIEFVTQSGHNLLVADEIFKNVHSIVNVLNSVDATVEPEKQFILQQKILQELFDNDSSIEAISITAGALGLHETFTGIDENTRVNVFSTRVDRPIILDKNNTTPNIYIYENIGDDLDLKITDELMMKIIYLGLTTNGVKKYRLESVPLDKFSDLSIIEISTNNSVTEPKEFLKNEKIFVFNQFIYTF